MTVLYIFYITF